MQVTTSKTVIVTALLNIINLHPGFAYEYSIRDAYCNDIARNSSHKYSSSYHYDYQVAYKKCMRNANELIKNHELQKERRHKNQLQRYYQQESERKQRKKIQLEQEAKARRKQEEEKRKLDLWVENSDNFFR